MMSVPDMTALDGLDEEKMLDNLEERLKQNEPYTYVSTVLVAVNPLKEIKAPAFETFVDKSFDPTRPHPNALAELAYQRLQGGRAPDQSIVVSGESGAGKTESSRIVIQYLTRRATSKNSRKDLASRIVAMSPVLEAFGNASTLRNHNSSRFGRFVKLLFKEEKKTTSLALVGGELETYLLEKSRAVRQNSGERNFHAMHMTVGTEQKGPSKMVTKELAWNKKMRCMPEPNDQNKNHVGAKAVPTLDAVETSLKAIGFNSDDVDAIWRTLGAVVALADVHVSGDDSAAIDVKEAAAKATISLLDLGESEILSTTLCRRTMRTRDDVLEVPRSVPEAATARDAACRCVYGRLFDKLVQQCNKALLFGGSEEGRNGSLKFLGILDIFGFEILEHNGLETLLINYANEALQQLFCDAVFAAELSLYEAEGIATQALAELAPPSSKPTLDLLAGRTPPGILKLLDAQCETGGNDNKKSGERDANFLAAVHRDHKTRLGSTPHRDKRQLFHVNHFAGTVPYVVVDDVQGGADAERDASWVATNLDAVPDGLLAMLGTSSALFVANLASDTVENHSTSGASALTPPNIKRAGGPSQRRTKTIASRFAASMAALAHTLQATDCGFIRCIKPTPKMIPDTFERDYVRDQLRALGIVAATEVLRVGLPHRVEYNELLQILPANAKETLKGEPPDLVISCSLAAFEIPADDYRLGKTRVFFPASALSRINDVLAFDPVADPAKAKIIEERLLKAKEVAGKARMIVEDAVKFNNEANESAKDATTQVGIKFPASEVEDDHYDDSDEAKKVDAAVASAETDARESLVAATRARSAVDGAKVDDVDCPEATTAKEAAVEYTKTAEKRSTECASLLATAKKHAARVHANERAKESATKAMDDALKAAKNADIALDDAKLAARRLNLTDLEKATKRVHDHAKTAAKYAAATLKLIEAKPEEPTEPPFAGALSAAAEASRARVDAERAADLAEDQAQEAAALAKDQRDKDDELRLAKLEEDRLRKEEDDRRQALAATTLPSLDEQVDSAKKEFRRRISEGKKSSASQDDDDDDDEEDGDEGPGHHDADAALSEDDEEDPESSPEVPKKRTSSGRPDPKRHPKRIYEHLRGFKRWFVLEEVKEEKKRPKLVAKKSVLDGSRAQEPLSPPVPKSSHHSLRDLVYRGLTVVPSDETPDDARTGLLHATVRRKKGGVVSSVQFELYLSSDPETMLASARRISASSPNYGLYDETVSSVKRELLARIRESSLTEPPTSVRGSKQLGQTSAAFFGHQRALRGGAPREIAAIVGPSSRPPSSSGDVRATRQTSTRSLILQSADGDEFDPTLNVYVQRDPAKRDGKYSLDFKGRGKVASVKNFQLVKVSKDANTHDHTVLQFCKVSANRFNLDFAPPFTPLSAFALAVSTCLT